jgi:hypothetical protein
VNPFLVYHPTTRPSGRALARAMKIPYGLISHYSLCKADKIIRWGTIENPVLEQQVWRKIFNEEYNIRLASHKYRSLKKLRADGVPVPDFGLCDYRESQSGPLPINADGTLRETIFQRRFHHTRGTDIVITKQHEGYTWTLGNFWTKYIKPHKEYRVHVIGGQVIICQKKFWSEENMRQALAGERREEEPGDELAGFGEMVDLQYKRGRKDFIRNWSNGWFFHTMNNWSNMPANAIPTAIRAVESLGLDFGAVDIISTEEKDEQGKRKVYVLEVNTAPGIEGDSLLVYADKLWEMINAYA